MNNFNKTFLDTFAFLIGEKYGQSNQTDSSIFHNRKTFGGSEVSAFFAKTPTQFKKLVEKKKNNIYYDISHMDAICWGNLFEYVQRNIMEYYCGYQILETPGNIKGPVFGTSCSPDGIGMIDINGISTLCVYEFKCPYSRAITSKTPKEYLYQVLHNINVLQFPVVGIFSEMSIRICTESQCKYSNFDYVPIANESNLFSKVHYCGKMLIYKTEKYAPRKTLMDDCELSFEYSQYSTVRVEEDGIYEIFDPIETMIKQYDGEISSKLAYRLFTRLNKDEYRVETITYNKDTDYTCNSGRENADLYCFWKILDMRTEMIPKDPNFWKPITKKINMYNDIICSAIPNDEIANYITDNWY